VFVHGSFSQIQSHICATMYTYLVVWTCSFLNLYVETTQWVWPTDCWSRHSVSRTSRIQRPQTVQSCRWSEGEW